MNDYNKVNAGQVSKLVITAEDRALVESLCPPEPDKAAPQPMDFEKARFALMALVQSPSSWEIGQHLEPAHFEDNGHQTIFKVFKSARERHGGLPSYDVACSLIEDAYPHDKPCAWEVIGELCEVWNTPMTDADPGIITDRLRAYLTEQRLRILVSKAIDLSKKKGPAAAIEFIAQESATGDPFTGDDAGLMDLDEFRAVAEAQQEDWLIPGWLEAGCLHLFSAVPKAGKTSTVCALVVSLLTGKDWFGNPAKQSPVLFLPFEGKEKFIWENLRLALGDTPADGIKGMFHAPKTRVVPVSGQRLRKLIKATGQEKGTVIIDSARACFPSKVEDWENKASEVRRVMSELTAVALETGWAILVIHHNNKQDDPSGSTDWKGAVDYVWTMTSDSDTVRKLRIEGRLIQPTHPFGIRKLPDGRLERTATEHDEKRTEKAKQVDQFIGVLGLGEKNKKSGPEVRKVLGIEDERRFSELAKEARKRERVGWSEHSGSTPAYYWLEA